MSRPFPRLRTGRAVVASLTVTCTLALSGCAAAAVSTSSPSSGSGTAAPSGSRSASSTLAASPAASSPTSSDSSSSTGSGGPTPVAGSGPPQGYSWRSSPGSAAIQVATTDGGAVSLMWMDPTRLRFRYVPGTQVPEGSPATPADSNPRSWVPLMLAAFDSGFKLSDHVGGYYYLGRTVSPLRDGLASMVVHQDGSLSIGVWGRDLHMTPDTLVVRQNLPPIVLDGVGQTSPSDRLRTWGLPTHQQPQQNRSGLGRRADGSLVFVYAHDVTASTLASVLVKAGAQMAIVLDMNLSWPTGFLYAHTNGQVVGSKINHWATRSPATYLARFKKDFVVVEGA